MRRILGVMAVGLAAAAAAGGHEVYVVPDANDRGKAVVVFGHGLKPDPEAKTESFDKVAGIRLVARVPGGPAAETVAKTTRDGNALVVGVPEKAKAVYGVVETGVYQKGDAKPVLVKYYVKAVIGRMAAANADAGDTTGGAVGSASLPFEIVPRVEGGRVRFQVVRSGQPVGDAEVTVTAHGEGKATAPAKATADSTGFTPWYDGNTRYAVVARVKEDRAGEAGGKKYEAVSHVLTLVVDVK